MKHMVLVVQTLSFQNDNQYIESQARNKENSKGNLSICMHGPEQSSKDKHTVHLRGSLFWANNCQIQLTEYEP
jgi:hypothetical protein